VLVSGRELARSTNAPALATTKPEHSSKSSSPLGASSVGLEGESSKPDPVLIYPPTFDYTLPRMLHDDHAAPLMLSRLDEPIRRVIEDMREQRMSLCQSLRQYVFVHRAVLEGALALVDEERRAFGNAWIDTEGVADEAGSAQAHHYHYTHHSHHGHHHHQHHQHHQHTHHHHHQHHQQVAPKPSEDPIEDAFIDADASSPVTPPPASSSPLKAKRGASPTELPHVDAQGGVVLSKRPSIKRKQREQQRSSDDGSIVL